MKPECKKCLMPNRSKEWCVKRQCKHADMPPPVVPPEELLKSKWPMCEDEEIGDDNIKLVVFKMDYNSGDFVGRIEHLKDAVKDRGHFGSYVSEGQYYLFKLIGDDKDEKIWEIPEEGTDRFHREGSTGAQFLLYWFSDSGFLFDLDT